MTLKSYDAVASSYDDGRSDLRWSLWDALTASAVDRVIPPAPARVLDAGAGTGSFSVWLLERGYEVVVLDPSKQMLAVAQEKVRSRGLSDQATFVEGRVEDLTRFQEGAFDFVFSDGDPLSYCIGTQRLAAAEMLRVLRPGGHFYASCDNRWLSVFLFMAQGNLEQAKRCADDGVSIDPYGNPVHAFEAEELHALFVDAGAEDVEVTGKIGLLHLLRADQAGALLRAGSPHREDFIRYEERLATSSSAAAFASHLQVTGRKP